MNNCKPEDLMDQHDLEWETIKQDADVLEQVGTCRDCGVGYLDVHRLTIRRKSFEGRLIGITQFDSDGIGTGNGD